MSVRLLIFGAFVSVKDSTTSQLQGQLVHAETHAYDTIESRIKPVEASPRDPRAVLGGTSATFVERPNFGIIWRIWPDRRE